MSLRSPSRSALKKTALTGAAAVAACALTVSSAAYAGAAAGPKVTVLSSDVLAPFNVAVSKGTLYAADGFLNTIFKVGPSGLTPFVSGPQPAGEVAGLTFTGSGDSMAYTTTDYATGHTSLTIKTDGQPDVVADLGAYEEVNNPDGIRFYGAVHPSDCARKAIRKATGGPAQYHGTVFSHPYSVATYKGNFYVADAGGNSILKVSKSGQVSTFAVAPRTSFTVTPDMAAMLGLPKCTIGVQYHTEGVPTDVEVAADGSLLVSLLPGGPEFGARGLIYKYNPNTGTGFKLAEGLAGPTNLAVSDSGRIYVAELFAGQISVLNKGVPVPYVSLPGALSVDASGDTLYAGTLAPTDDMGNPVGPGTLVKIK